MLTIEELSIRYGDHLAVTGASLEVPEASFVSLVGPSGSGKSSLLRAVMGLVTPTAGRVALQVEPSHVGFLFQDDALLPWRTVEQNIALGLRIRGLSQEESRARVRDWLERLGLAGLERRFPHQLSGGQRKRVALAQVLALKPRLLLMDEPFAALDAILRTAITQELLHWVEGNGMSVLLVTHDLEEALTLSDRIYLLTRGPGARVRTTLSVPFPRPRNLVATRSDPRFGPLLRTLWHELGAEGGRAGQEGSVAAEMGASWEVPVP